MIAALVLLALAVALSPKKKSTAPALPKPGGPTKLPDPKTKPDPEPDPEPSIEVAKIEAAICSLLGDGVAEAQILPVVLRVVFPAVSWPAADEWGSADVAALPSADRKVYRAAHQYMWSMLTTDQDLAKCTRMSSPYASGRVKWNGQEFVVDVSFDARVEGQAPVSIKSGDDIDRARTLLLATLWFFGAPGADTDTFVEAYLPPASPNRMSIWKTVDGRYRVQTLRGSNAPVYLTVNTLEQARAERTNLG